MLIKDGMASEYSDQNMSWGINKSEFDSREKHKIFFSIKPSFALGPIQNVPGSLRTGVKQLVHLEFLG
jgi:hypothetical protein